MSEEAETQQVPWVTDASRVALSGQKDWWQLCHRPWARVPGPATAAQAQVMWDKVVQLRDVRSSAFSSACR